MSKPWHHHLPVTGDLIQIWDHMAVRANDCIKIDGHGHHAIVIGETKKEHKPHIIEGDVFRVITMTGEHKHVHWHNMKVFK